MPFDFCTGNDMPLVPCDLAIDFAMNPFSNFTTNPARSIEIYARIKVYTSSDTPKTFRGVSLFQMPPRGKNLLAFSAPRAEDTFRVCIYCVLIIYFIQYARDCDDVSVQFNNFLTNQ